MKLLSTWRRPGIALLAAIFFAMAATNARAGGTVGTTGFGGARIGTAGGSFGGIGRSTSIIRHGDTGFSIYSQQGVTRVIGTPKVSKNVRLPDGRSTRVIGDGNGGAQTFGPRGSQRVFGNPRLLDGDDP